MIHPTDDRESFPDSRLEDIPASPSAHHLAFAEITKLVDPQQAVLYHQEGRKDIPTRLVVCDEGKTLSLAFRAPSEKCHTQDNCLKGRCQVDRTVS